jgi:serine/threonine-protein kinase
MAPTFVPDYTLAGRYRILELVGVGRTAEVYAAEDLSLQRRVAVKVLLPDLAAHEDIRRAFRDRIIRASKLSHPHLARVFDGGQEHGAIFMISEYLSGGSLEDVLRSGRHLSVDEGARLGRDVADALAYVHEHGFILGSLSPSKLLFDDEGRVRVSDIALSGLAAGYRERMSLDDARYLSPEQAIGEPAGAESDVYALALILFEAVTGSAAYEGTTPEAILRARLSAPLPVRLELGTLDMVLAQAALPDPRLRLDSEQFSTRLGGLLGDDAPLVIRGGVQETPLLSQFERPEPRNSIGFRAPSADQIVNSPSGSPTGAFPRVSRISAAAGAAPPRGPISPLGRTPRFDRGQYDLPRTPRRRTGFLVAAVVLVILALGAGAAWKAGVFSKSHTVPTLTGLTLKQATIAVKPDGYTLVVADVESNTVAKNDIVRQSPAAGTSAKSGSSITVDVSLGPKLVTMPTDLQRRTCAGATAALRSLHVTATCPTANQVYSSTVPINDVAGVLYNKTSNPLAVPRGASVILDISKGPSSGTPGTTTTTLAGQGLRAVPNVVGDTYAETVAAFQKAVLYFSTTGPGAGTTTWTSVVSENPGAGTMVAYKSTVTLTVK